MKKYGEVEVIPPWHEIEARVQLTFGPFFTGKSHDHTWVRKSGGLRFGLNVEEKRGTHNAAGNRTPVVQHIAFHFADRAVKACNII
jgi:hypothetical protein